MGKALFVSTILFLTAAYVPPAPAESNAAEAANGFVRTPFVAVQEELQRAADNILAGTVLPAVTSDDAHNLASSAALDVGQHWPTTNPGAGAMKRLEELRPVLQPILKSEGVPAEMESVVAVESGGRTKALSRKGARGLWQLMPDTARQYGLVVKRHKDERLDVKKATRAAARYLHHLYQHFGSWSLALAGYNAGEHALENAIQRAGTPDFLELSRQRLLPEETCNYVPAVLSVMQRLGHEQLSDRQQAAGMSEAGEPVIVPPDGQP